MVGIDKSSYKKTQLGDEANTAVLYAVYLAKPIAWLMQVAYASCRLASGSTDIKRSSSSNLETIGSNSRRISSRFRCNQQHRHHQVIDTLGN